MMGSSKHHLKHLLNEDQEPFVLKNFINEKRSQLNKTAVRTQIKLKTQNPISQNSSFSCKNVCFLSFQDSQSALTKSPLFEFSSQSKSPCRNSNTLFVHIPAKTAALLLEAALRIQTQSESPKPKTSKNLGFGFIGSILKKLRRRKKSEIKRDGEIRVSVKDILRREPSDVCGIVTEEREEELEIGLGLEEKRVSDVGLSCSCNSRVSSAWTESNEEKSTSTSRSEASEETEEVVVVQEQSENCEFDSFRFILQNGSSPLRRSPELVSPATSPNRRKNQAAKKNEEGHISSDEKEQNEEEHCSPVSVLDLQIDDDVEDEYEDEQEDEYDSELERSFAFVQKAKQKLLHKLRRFERLAELDPLELDKILTEDEDEDEFDNEEDDKEDNDYVLQDDENCDLLIREVHRGSSCSNGKRVPLDMKRLVIDLLDKEGSRAEASSSVLVADKLYKRFSSLKGTERKTVNIMVEMVFKGEQNEWQKNSEHVEETVVAVELSIFDFLVEEFSIELVNSNDLRKF